MSIRNRSSCSPATSQWTGRPTSRSAERKPPSATRPSPATGIRSPPSPGGAASEAISTPPPPTASPRSTQSATHSPENPGYRHCPPSADTNSRHPVNGHARGADEIPVASESAGSELTVTGIETGTPGRFTGAVGIVPSDTSVTGSALLIIFAHLDMWRSRVTRATVRPGPAGPAANGLALSRFNVIYATPPCVITPRSPVQGSCAVQEHPCLTRPYAPKARTLGPAAWSCYNGGPGHCS